MKTTALIGLGHDSKNMAHFIDGVLFLSVGASVTEVGITCELCKIMPLTGSVSQASVVAAATSLSEAVSHAAMWFQGKRILFLIDDVGLRPGRPQGLMRKLSSLLQGSPDCRIAFSTRSTAIGVTTGSQVDFGALDPQGNVAVEIFMSHTRQNFAFRGDKVPAARGILDRCAGLPITLAVAV